MIDRAILVLGATVALAASGCGSAPGPEPAAPVPIASGAPVAAAEAEPPNQQVDVAPSWLLGAWSWEGDVVVYRDDGRGVYYRDGAVCYEFSYTVQDGVLSIHADDDSGCQGRRDNDYRIELVQDRIEQTHIGSDYQTTWERSQEPRPQDAI